jgi:hypothetical protein
MTRERLQSIPLEELTVLARNAGLEPIEPADRAELIEALMESFEELRQEREEGNSPSVRVEEKKYEVAADEELEPPGVDPFLVPARYNETRVVLMIRDPHWAFAYWDIEDQTVQRVRKDPNFEQLVLRVHDCRPSTSFDIPIQGEDSSWYIYLPSPDCDYSLELGYLAAGRFKLLARSNQIRTPRDTIVEAGELDERTHSLFFGVQPEALEGSSRAASSESIPQRILAAMRE